MPLDALCLTAVAAEIRAAVQGGKIDKIYQPTRDEVVLYIRGPAGNVRLLLSANPGHPRAHLTERNRENPEQPPMFCMLLRKHLAGGRIAAIQQPALERVVFLTIDMVDELGEPGQRKLVLECMGPRSNLILLDGQDRIVDCLRRVDMEMSPDRQVLPGLFYRLPPAQDKLDPLAVEDAELDRLFSQAGQETECATLLLSSFFGLSPLICRGIA